MAAIVDHLNFLVGSSLSQQNVSHGNRRVLEEWQAYQDSTAGNTAGNAIDIEDQDTNQWSSVLNIYTDSSAGAGTSTSGQSSCISQLLKKPNSGSLLRPVYESLSSGRDNDVVSAELADILGFDDFELIEEILRERGTALRQLDQILSSNVEPSKHRLDSNELSSDVARARMEQKFRENAARPLFKEGIESAPEVLPNVYSSSMSQGNVLSQFGQKYLLPLGTERHMHEEYEEVIIPPARPVPPKTSERLIMVDELSSLAKPCFPGYKSLNRIQSIVYPTAYGTNENLLICAPTGAGKTDVAMLTILRVLDQHRSAASSNRNEDASQIAASIDKDSFKIIYVAPMKALAAEIVRKLGKRLKWLSIQVRELTGDMQMTKAEIAETQIIVTTPEKWDVVTRKPTGEGEIVSTLRLLIIDEVHLLNEERGAVIEAIVARTLRRVESTQSMIRIVGLSATLPNYVDVADFLSASRYKGLFYFDSSFRPIPLEQHFLGIKGKPGSDQSRKNLDRVTFEKVSELVAQGHQVMVFVHARKETVKSALALKEAATIDGSIDQFGCQDHPQFGFFRRDVGQSRNKEMKLLFDHGFGIHHAGMLRSDRNLMERLFEARAIKVLCCTATLAWGVNLPAHAVVIKGTQVYDSSRGSFVDLSVLDVLQIFGRAGRPGLETSGEGYICTTEDKLTHYLEAVTSQIPIESQFHKGIIDSLNAEIALGTVASVSDAVQWLGYTYLFVRMQKNPFIYGMIRDAILDDPRLVNKRNELVVAAARKLAEIRMIVYDNSSGSFTITDLGRIAAKYYIRYTTIEIFVKQLRPKMTEADALGLLSQSTEFDQIQVRESEMKEMEGLLERAPCVVKDGLENTPGKVNVLLQAYISREIIDDFALVSDSAFVAQNGGRIIRALLEIAMSRKLAGITGVLMGLSKAIENRLWPFDHPLRQFDLRQEVLYNLVQWADDWSVAELASQDAAALGKLIHLNEHHGQALLNVAKQFPALSIEYDLRPLGHDVLKIAIQVHRNFSWNPKVHGSAQSFWVWIEDDEGVSILQLAHLLFRPNTQRLSVDFVISIPETGPPPSLVVRYVSDRWMGAEDELWIPLDQLVMPMYESVHTPLLDLPLLGTAITSSHPAIRSVLERLRMDYFNATQTQAFWSLFKTHCHSLICGPPGSGKSAISQLLAWASALESPQFWALVIVPHKDLAAEAVSELRRLSSGISINYFQGTDVLELPKGGRTIRVVQASHLLDALVLRNAVPIVGLDLVVCENLELLDSAYELVISSLKHLTQSSPTRFIGISTSLNNPSDLADWLDVDPVALHSFQPKDRDQSLKFIVQPFTIPHSAALLKAMAKPAYTAISDAGRDGASIVFVPSRGQCKNVALDLLTQRTLESESDRGYLPEDTDQRYLEDFLARFRDQSVIDYVSKGVGFYHTGLHKTDRNLMLELFTYGIIRVLLVPREACWALPVRASVVVVMGAQYLDASVGDTDRQIRDYGLAELMRMQSRAVQHSGEGTFHLFCQAEAKDTITRFLNEGLPLESQLLETEVLATWLGKQKPATGKLDPQQVLDILSLTYLSRRVAANPVYYDCAPRVEGSENDDLSRLVDRILERAG